MEYGIFENVRFIGKEDIKHSYVYNEDTELLNEYNMILNEGVIDSIKTAIQKIIEFIKKIINKIFRKGNEKKLSEDFEKSLKNLDSIVRNRKSENIDYKNNLKDLNKVSDRAKIDDEIHYPTYTYLDYNIYKKCFDSTLYLIKILERILMSKGSDIPENLKVSIELYDIHDILGLDGGIIGVAYVDPNSEHVTTLTGLYNNFNNNYKNVFCKYNTFTADLESMMHKLSSLETLIDVRVITSYSDEDKEYAHSMIRKLKNDVNYLIQIAVHIRNIQNQELEKLKLLNNRYVKH